MKICLKAYAAVAVIVCGASFVQASEKDLLPSHAGSVNTQTDMKEVGGNNANLLSRTPPHVRGVLDDQKRVAGVRDDFLQYIRDHERPLGYGDRNVVYSYASDFMKEHYLQLLEIHQILEYITMMHIELPSVYCNFSTKNN